MVQSGMAARDDIEAKMLWDAVEKHLLELRTVDTAFTMGRGGGKGGLGAVRTPHAWYAERRNNGFDQFAPTHSTYQETARDAVLAWLRGEHVDPTTGRPVDLAGRITRTIWQGRELSVAELRSIMSDVPAAQMDAALRDVTTTDDFVYYTGADGQQWITSQFNLPNALKHVQWAQGRK